MKTIVCYGDSNTWGYMPKHEKPICTARNRYPWGVRWTSRLQKALGEEYRIVEAGLNGRTTAFEMPYEIARSGLAHIDARMLESAPVDLVIVMLGTNDVKEYFNLPPYAVRCGAERLIQMIQAGGYGVDDGVPEILLVSPIHIHPSYADAWLGEEFGPKAIEKDRALAGQLKTAAENTNAHFLDAGQSITADEADGIHMSAEGHARLAELLLEKIREIL